MSTITTTLPPDWCEDPEPCPAVYPTDCIIYSGGNINCIGVVNGMSVTDVVNIFLEEYGLICTTTTTTVFPPPTTTTSTSTTSTTTTSSTTTTTTAAAIQCDCITFNNTSSTTQECWYTDCNGEYIPLPVPGNTVVSYCGCCGGTASPSVVFITTGLACVNGDCQTTTSTTSTTTIAPEAAKCVDCILQLDNVTQNAIGTLSVGDLISTATSACVVGDYVIDWYLDSTSNPIEFTSGIGSDPAIDQLHPFTGTAARPCVAGNWIPVIRYAYLDGTKYTSTYTPGGGNVYSPDLAACLEPVVVENLNCLNGNITPNPYTHLIEYQAIIQNPADSVRTFRFDLGPTVNYFAWQFFGFFVSDKIEFYHVSGATQTLLGKYAIGLDISTNFTGDVKEIYGVSFSEVFDISNFSFLPGDYINIIITSSYGQPSNQNTNWKLLCKCLETFDCTFGSPAVIDPCSAVMTYNSTACSYELTYNYSYFPDYSTTDSAVYLLDGLVNPYGIITHYPTVSEPYISYRMRYGQFCNKTTLPPGSCVNGSLKTFSKSGGIYTLTFTDGAEYLIWKNHYLSNYNYLIGAYSSDPTNVNHYRFLSTRYILDPGLLGCGDNLSSKTIMYHITSPVTFDDINFIMTIDPVNTVYSLTPLCDGTCSDIPEIVTTANTINEPDFAPISSTVRPNNQGYVYYSVSTTSADVAYVESYYNHLLPYGSSGYICDGTPGFCVKDVNLPPSSYSITTFYKFADYVKITDITDGANNFKIQSKIDANGCLITDPNLYITVYEISNGVVTTPVGGCP